MAGSTRSPHAAAAIAAAVAAAAAVVAAIAVGAVARRRQRVAGLRNWGESRCYVNAVLQALSATRRFSDSLAAPRGPAPLGDALRCVADALNGAAPVPVASALADRVLAEFRKAGGALERGQQDAHEFLVRLVEAVRSEGDTARQRGAAGLALARELNSYPMPPMRQPCLLRAGRRRRRGGEDGDGGECAEDTGPWGLWGLESGSVVCLSCSSSSTELLVPFGCVTLTLPLTRGVLTVSELLADHFRPEFVSGYRCEVCAARRRRSTGDSCKLSRAARLPRLLVVHLSRLPVVGFKNEARVRVDEWLDMAPFARGWEPVAKKETRGEAEPYRLTAVIAHAGNATGGHYVCYRRAIGGEGSDGGWVLASDERVVPVPLSTVQMAAGAYLCLYEPDALGDPAL